MSEKPTRILVDLLVRSGEDNPSWEAGTRLLHRLEAAFAAAEPTLEGPKPRTGYNGFRVRTLEGSPAFPAQFTVFNKILTIHRDGKKIHLRDTGGVELLLIGEAGEMGYGSEIPDTYKN